MQIPVDITYKEMAPTEALNLRIQDWVAKLERVYDRIIRCEVLVETPHRHHRQGRRFHVRVRVTIPGGIELISSRDPGIDGGHEDAYVAVRDAFTAVRRQLEERVHERRAPVYMSERRNSWHSSEAAPPSGTATGRRAMARSPR